MKGMRFAYPSLLEIGPGEELIRRRTVAITSDLYAIGHFLLFMLYSTFESIDDQEDSTIGWEEELSVTGQTKQMIRKLLQIDPPYVNAQSCIEDLDAILKD